MIIEFIKYLTNPASRAAKKLGQLQETIALEARYKRSREQWASHLKHSKEIMISASKSISADKDIIVLGSGLLLDIPLDYLSDNFNHVFLLDVVHLKKIKQITEHYKNITLVEQDITGLSDSIFDATKNHPTLTPKPDIPCLTPNTGLVISANMLSQIHLAPVFYAESKLAYSEQQLEQLAHDIMISHLRLLSTLPCKVCLLTDFVRLYKDKNQNIVTTESVLFDIELPKPDKTWYWEIAPRGELDKHFSMTSMVYAYEDYSNRLP